MSDRRSNPSRPPSPLLLMREWLAFAELGAHYASMPWWGFAPRGDGAPVLVLPGLVQSDFSTRPLRRFLTALGHAAYGWQLGANSGRMSFVDEHLAARVQTLYEQHGRKVALVGWSMGGLFARSLARIAPHAVRQVITLGSPFAGDPKASNAWRLYEATSGQRAGDPNIDSRFRGALPVPVTSVYSRRDGIVAWQCCLNEPGPQAENIEVVSTHCGMGHHPAVLYAVADRLAQPEGAWRPFEPVAVMKWLYPAREPSPQPSGFGITSLARSEPSPQRKRCPASGRGSNASSAQLGGNHT